MSSIFKFCTRKKIFLSYRREGGLWIARTIFYYFRSRGVDCYFDYDSFQDPGHFDEKISQAIRTADFFMPLLTPQSVDIPEDGSENWFRRELELAAGIKKDDQIIPLVIKGSDVSLSDDPSELIRRLDTINRFEIDAEALFDESLRRVVNKCPALRKQIEQADQKKGDANLTAFRRKSRRLYRLCLDGRLTEEARNAKIHRLIDYYGLSVVEAEDTLQNIVDGFEDDRRRRIWVASHPFVVLMILAGIAGAVLWGAMRLSPDFEQTVREKAQTVQTAGVKQLHDLGRWIQSL